VLCLPQRYFGIGVQSRSDSVFLSLLFDHLPWSVWVLGVVSSFDGGASVPRWWLSVTA